MKKQVSFFNKLKKGFSLAEVLITVSLLGVVATMTISTIHQQHKKVMLETKLKDAYSILSELTQLSRAENRGIPFEAVDDPTNRPSEFFWNKYIAPYIEISHDCGYNRTGCFAGPNGGWYNPKGEPWSNANNGYGTGSFHKVILKNGMSLAYQYCKTCLGSNSLFVIDIDGPNKGYSKMGQDVFVFEWQDPKKIPEGMCLSWMSHRPPSPEITPYATPCVAANVNWQYQGGWYLENRDEEIQDNCRGDDGYWGQKNSFFQGGAGTNCAAWIAKNGWKIPRDYPWKQVNLKPENFHRP